MLKKLLFILVVALFLSVIYNSYVLNPFTFKPDAITPLSIHAYRKPMAATFTTIREDGATSLSIQITKKLPS